MIRLFLSSVLIVLAMAISALADDRPNVLFCFSDESQDTGDPRVMGDGSAFDQ